MKDAVDKINEIRLLVEQINVRGYEDALRLVCVVNSLAELAKLVTENQNEGDDK